MPHQIITIVIKCETFQVQMQIKRIFCACEKNVKYYLDIFSYTQNFCMCGHFDLEYTQIFSKLKRTRNKDMEYMQKFSTWIFQGRLHMGVSTWKRHGNCPCGRNNHLECKQKFSMWLLSCRIKMEIFRIDFSKWK